MSKILTQEEIALSLTPTSLVKRKELSQTNRELITKRCAAVDKSEKLEVAERLQILRTVARLIVETRNQTLFENITGMKPAYFLEKIESGESPINLKDILRDFNAALLARQSEKKIYGDEIRTVQRLKATFGDIVMDKVMLADTRKQTAALREQADKKKALEEVKVQIDSIIDEERGKRLEDVLNSIACYLHDALGRDTIKSLAISYVNEENDYLEHKHLTRAFQRGYAVEALPAIVTAVNSDAFPSTVFSSKKNTNIYDPEKNTSYISLKLGKQCLGIIEIEFKNPEERLSEDQEAVCHQAISVIDTFLDGRLKNLRKDKLRRKIARIVDRSGTDIVFENGREKGFRKGLIDMLRHLCSKTGAEYIMLAMDVTGDKASFPLQLLVNKDGEHNDGNAHPKIEKLESRARDITVPMGIDIDDQTPTQVDGKIIFYGEDLDDEDQSALELAAEQIISTVRSWRVDLHNTILYGLPPKVALLRKKGLLKTRSVEEVSMGFTDIYGFTGISEKFREITRKYGLKEDYMIRLMGAYDQMGKDIAEKWGGCYDKLVGDCIIINNGPPYTTDGRDGLGSAHPAPMYHAMNSLKIALRIRHELPQIEKVFADLLAEMAEEVEKKDRLTDKTRKTRDKARHGKTPEEVKAMRLREFCSTHKIHPKLQVTQGISSGEVSVGLVSGNDETSNRYSMSYTIIGDEMNLAARLQSNATPHEIIVSKETKEYLERAMNGNIAVPTDENGHRQTWEEFKAEILGTDFEQYNLIPVFEETMLDLKNKAGYEFAYRLSFQKVSRQPVAMEDTMIESELRKLSGHFKIIRRDPKDQFLEVQLENLYQPDQRFSAIIKHPREIMRYVTPENYDLRVQNDSETVLQVQNGEIALIEYVSIEDLINEQMQELHQEVDVLETDKIPHGIYTVKARHEQEDSDEIILEVEMNGVTLMVKVKEGNLLPLKELEDKPKAGTIFEVHRYIHKNRNRKRSERLSGYALKQGQPKKEEIFFVHSSGEFIGKLI